ncbi:MAG: hypothetical protein OXC46_04245 [Thaumarchaeota archaeon]|nr:hypothetical protein [Nitrososphaerota archaeon]
MIENFIMQFDTNYGLALTTNTYIATIMMGLGVTAVAVLALRGQLGQLMGRGKNTEE